MKGYIYVITNNINGMQYIGQTIQLLNKRWNNHIFSSKHIVDNDNSYLHRSMRKYKVENFSIKEIQEVHAKTKQELNDKLNELEIHYIEKYNTLKPNGYNISPGGGIVSPESKIYVDQYDLDGNLINENKTINEVEKYLNLSNCGTNIIRNCNGKYLSAYNYIWRFHGDNFMKYEIPNRVQKEAMVDKYSLDGEFIETFDSLSSAYNSLDNITKNSSSGHICDCCNGRINSSNGYVWRYHGDDFNKYSSKDKRYRSCSIYTKDGELLGTYNTIEEACIAIGKDPQKSRPSISGVLKGRRKTAYGYIWKYC